jgi:hypothetical protein
MAAADLDALVDAISTARSLKPHQPENRDAEAAKIVRLRQLRLAREAMEPPTKPRQAASAIRPSWK